MPSTAQRLKNEGYEKGKLEGIENVLRKVNLKVF
jgi:hypothetical protein